MPNLLAFGDSNTFGIRPLPDESTLIRLPFDKRWPGVAVGKLGANWSLREEGLSGRTICRADPEMGAHMDGRLGLAIAAGTSAPIDVLTIMLGSNDLKAHFGVNARQMVNDIADLLDLCEGEYVAGKHPQMKILLIAPPPPFEAGVLKERFSGSAKRGDGFGQGLFELAQGRKIGFLDAGEIINCDPLDGVHFDAPAHIALGLAVADAIHQQIL